MLKDHVLWEGEARGGVMGRVPGNPQDWPGRATAYGGPAPTLQAGLAPCFWTSQWPGLGLGSVPFTDYYWPSTDEIALSS